MAFSTETETSGVYGRDPDRTNITVRTYNEVSNQSYDETQSSVFTIGSEGLGHVWAESMSSTDESSESLVTVRMKSRLMEKDGKTFTKTLSIKRTSKSVEDKETHKTEGSVATLPSGRVTHEAYHNSKDHFEETRKANGSVSGFRTQQSDGYDSNLWYGDPNDQWSHYYSSSTTLSWSTPGTDDDGNALLIGDYDPNSRQDGEEDDEEALRDTPLYSQTQLEALLNRAKELMWEITRFNIYGNLKEFPTYGGLIVIDTGEQQYVLRRVAASELTGETFATGEDGHQYVYVLVGVYGTHLNTKIAAELGRDNFEKTSAEEKDLLWELGRLIYDITGIVDPTPASDGMGAAMAIGSGEPVQAGISAVAMLPFVLEWAKLLKLSKLESVVDKVIEFSLKNPRKAFQYRGLLENLNEALSFALSGSKLLPTKSVEILNRVKSKIDDFLVKFAEISARLEFMRKAKLSGDPNSPNNIFLFENRLLSVQEFISKYRKGGIKGVVPAEALGMSLEEALRAGHIGGVDIRKLLQNLRDKFMK